MRKIGYVFIGKKTPSRQEQVSRLVEAGCDKDGIWFDTNPRLRPERRDMIDLAVYDGEGDVVIICNPAIIGSGEKDTAKAILALGAKDCAVQVIGGDPVIYTDPEQAAEFGRVALKASRRANALENVRSGRVGRKSKWEMQEVEEGLLRILWHDPRVPMVRILEVVRYLGGENVTRENLYARLGKRELKEGQSDDQR